MIRDLDRLTGQTFDVLVIGGGIHGLCTAYDVAQRGGSVALVERDDFGSGSSFNHLRTIHGGLRYLQSFDLKRARESVRERRTLARIAPHAVQPLPFALPLYRSVTRGKLAMRAGLILDRVVSSGRNRGVPASHRLPAGRIYSRAGAIANFPGLKRQGLTGAAVWYDYVTLEPDRLTFAWALAAHEHGAILANHVAAMSIARENGRVTGIHAADMLTGNRLDISARVVVNATGAMADRLLESVGAASGVPTVRAMNLVTRRDAGQEALGGRSASGRNLFMVPWRDRAIFGTWESSRLCGPDDRSIDGGEVAAFISELNGAFPALDLTPADITLVHQGVVPAVVNGDRVTLEGHDRIRDHQANGADGLITVLGPKYTTARAIAERTTDLVWRKLRRPQVSCRTASTVLPGGSIRDVGLAIADARREHDEGLPTDAIPHLIAAYGSRFRDVIDVANGRADLRTRIAPDSPVIGAELVVAVRHEMALTLGDAVIRRTPLGALGYPGDDAVVRAAEVVGPELKWSDERKRTEAASVRAFYAWPAKATAP